MKSPDEPQRHRSAPTRARVSAIDAVAGRSRLELRRGAGPKRSDRLEAIARRLEVHARQVQRPSGVSSAVAAIAPDPARSIFARSASSPRLGQGAAGRGGLGLQAPGSPRPPSGRRPRGRERVGTLVARKTSFRRVAIARPTPASRSRRLAVADRGVEVVDAEATAFSRTAEAWSAGYIRKRLPQPMARIETLPPVRPRRAVRHLRARPSRRSAAQGAQRRHRGHRARPPGRSSPGTPGGSRLSLRHASPPAFSTACARRRPHDGFTPASARYSRHGLRVLRERDLGLLDLGVPLLLPLEAVEALVAGLAPAPAPAPSPAPRPCR